MTNKHDNGKDRHEDRRAWVESNRCETVQDRKIIIGSVVLLTLICGSIFMFGARTSNVADRNGPMTPDSTGTTPAVHRLSEASRELATEGVQRGQVIVHSPIVPVRR